MVLSFFPFVVRVENIGRREQNGRDLGRDHYHNHNDDMREDMRELSSVERGAYAVYYLIRNCKFIFSDVILAESISSYEGSSRRRRRQKNNSAAHNSEYDVAKLNFQK